MAARTKQAEAEQNDIPHYSMMLTWDPEDNIYVVSVPELPGLHTHGETYEEAARKGAAFIETWALTLRGEGDQLPPAREWQP